MVYQFTNGPNTGSDGARVPGIFQWPSPQNLLQISNSIVDEEGGEVNADYLYQKAIELDTWYDIVISETKEGEKGYVSWHFLGQ